MDRILAQRKANQANLARMQQFVSGGALQQAQPQVRTPRGYAQYRPDFQKFGGVGDLRDFSRNDRINAWLDRLPSQGGQYGWGRSP